MYMYVCMYKCVCVCVTLCACVFLHVCVRAACTSSLKSFSPEKHLKIKEFGHLLSLQSHWENR